ncbi:MAG: hypothetical protein EXX96DRAFT_585173 [Benjaminiella poitrasii]|nr:MAG: hypothetical protein EXX96DRAFT_585173 [Benjaminiella poitrasii]
MIKSSNAMMNSIGLLFSFIGMVGLIISIITLVPLNGYNLYTTFNTIIDLLSFEIKRNNNDDWEQLNLSRDAKLYFIFLCGSFISSLSAIATTISAFFSSKRDINNDIELNKKQSYSKQRRRSWLLRFTCFTLLLQIIFSLFGAHIIYKIKSKTEIIPLDIQQDTMLSFAILCLSYLSLVTFSVVLLFASFCILLSAKYHQWQKSQQQESSGGTVQDERRPLITV